MARIKFNERINAAIEAASQKHGINPDAMRAFARIESGGRPEQQTGSYKGLFQLSDREFKKHGGSGDIFNPEANAMAAGAKLKAEAGQFERYWKRPPTAAEVYMIHQQGVGGSLAHWKNPDQPAWKNMHSTAEGQQKGEAWAKKAIWGNIPASEKAKFGSVENVPGRAFTDMWARIMAKQGEIKDITQPITMMAQGQQGQQPPTAVAMEAQSGMVPGQSAAPGEAVPSTAGEMKEAIATEAPDAIGPLGPVAQGAYAARGEDPFAGSNLTPQMPAIQALPAETAPAMASAAPSPGPETIASSTGIAGGGLFGGGGGGGLFGLGGGRGGGGGGYRPTPPAPNVLTNPQAEFEKWDPKQGDERVLLSQMPPPPPRTPPSLHTAAEVFGTRRKKQYG
jgi:hypothetical protein